jgi:hypothetical protein
MRRLKDQLRRLEGGRFSRCEACENRPVRTGWGPNSGMLKGAELEEAISRQERERRGEHEPCPECNVALPLIYVVWGLTNHPNTRPSVRPYAKNPARRSGVLSAPGGSSELGAHVLWVRVGRRPP